MSPVQPVDSPFANVHVPAVFSTAGVELTATFDPVTPWVDVITAAVSNVATLGQDWLTDPLPAVRQLGRNAIGYTETTATALAGAAQGAFTYLTTVVPDTITTALQQVAAGDLTGAAGTINNALSLAVLSIGGSLFPLLAIPGQMATNLTAVVTALTGLDNLLPVVLGVLAPIEGGIQSFGDSSQAVLDALKAGQVGTALNAAFAIAPNVVGAVLNGYQEGAYTGVLSPTIGGLVYSVAIAIPQAIATALGATSTTAAAAASKAVPSAEAVATAGTARSKLAAADPTSDSTAAVKDGNKFALGLAGGPGAAGARSAAASAKGGAANSGDSKGAVSKGHSGREAAGGDK
jgi:hypothetical protein